MIPYNLLVVAHPDDETLFFSGPLLNLRELPWMVVCVTWDRAIRRRKALKLACDRLGVNELRHWDFTDNYLIPLPSHHLIKKLRQLPPPASVFTHGARGEYGHLHHKNVHKAVQEAFYGHEKVYSIAYQNSELIFELSPEQRALRADIVANIYGFADQSWTQSADGFSRVRACEALLTQGL